MLSKKYYRGQVSDKKVVECGCSRANCQTFMTFSAWTGFQIKNLGNNTLLFIFDNPQDVDRVISSEPRVSTSTLWWFRNMISMSLFKMRVSIKLLSWYNT